MSELRHRLTPERRRWLWLVTISLIGSGGLSVSGILYVSRVEEQARRDMCTMFRAMDPPATAPLPADAEARKRLEAFRAYLAKRC
jgi:hypothetical protein